MKRLLLALPLLALALAAAAPLSAQSAPKKDRHFITEEEVRGSSAQNVYDLVRNLRPQWLRTRGDNAVRGPRSAASPTQTPLGVDVPEIVVYMDGIRFGKDADLRGLSTGDIATLRFLDASSAGQRFGGAHPNGAILLTRRVP